MQHLRHVIGSSVHLLCVYLRRRMCSWSQSLQEVPYDNGSICCIFILLKECLALAGVRLLVTLIVSLLFRSGPSTYKARDINEHCQKAYCSGNGDKASIHKLRFQRAEKTGRSQKEPNRFQTEHEGWCLGRWLTTEGFGFCFSFLFSVFCFLFWGQPLMGYSSYSWG